MFFYKIYHLDYQTNPIALTSQPRVTKKKKIYFKNLIW